MLAQLSASLPSSFMGSSSSSSSSSKLPDTLLPTSMQPMDTVSDIEAQGGGGGGGNDKSWWGSLQSMVPGTEASAAAAAAQAERDAANMTWLERLELRFSMSRSQRLIGFAGSIIFAIVCFATAMAMMPTVLLAPRKVLLLLTLGNVLAMLAFALLRGPASHLKHMFSAERRTLTLGYLLSIVATLYCVLWLRSGLLSMVMAGMQMVAVVVYLGTYLPMGSRAMSWMQRAVCVICRREMSSSSSSSSSSLGS